MYTPTNRTYADIMTKVSEATEEWVQKKLASADAKEETATVVTEEDKQEQMLRIFSEKYGTALFDYKEKQYTDELDNLKHKARGIVDEFNNYVKELEVNELYTERGKEDLYLTERRKVEKRLREIGDAQHQLEIDIQKIRVESAQTAWQKLESEMTPDTITPSEYQYIDMLLSRNNSDDMRQRIAKQFHYHIAVLDLLNAEKGVEPIRHPLEESKNNSVNYIRLGEMSMPERYASSYLSDLLRNFRGQVFLSIENERNQSAGKLV
ncbi:hypothetical protein MKL29_06860 [Streptococcus suis]|nr:hypothetical protein [Streptococcus suis]